MTKKFLAVTLVLVLAAGFAAVAQDDEKALTGTWENELMLDPTDGSDTFAGFDSLLSVTYTTAGGGITYTSDTEFNLAGLTKQELGVVSSVGLFTLSSTLNLDVSGSNLRFWESSADMTFGGVGVGANFYLQKIDWDNKASSGYEATFWPEYTPTTYPDYPDFGSVDGNLATRSTQTDSFVVDSFEYSEWEVVDSSDTTVNSFHNYGSGLELTFSGETPGGVTVDLTGTFGMMPTSDAEADIQDKLDKKVKNDLLNFAGESKLKNVTGEEAWVWLAELIGQNPVSESNPSELSFVLIGSQLSVGDADDSGEDYSSFTQLAEDFLYWLAEKEADNPTNNFENDASSVSDSMRDAALNIVQKTVTIGGVAGDTGRVVNTDFDLGDLGFAVDLKSKVADTSSASASLYLKNAEVGPAVYGGSSLQFYSALIELDNLSLGCCDFSNETWFNELDGFGTEFNFTMEMETFPVDLAATLKWDNDPHNTDTGKVLTLTPSLSTDWSCFTVWTDLGTSASGNVIDSLQIDGFSLSAELGHVEVTWVSALSASSVYALDTDGSYHAYGEVLRIDKLASAGELDFVLDYYTDFGSAGNGLMPVAIEGSASYPISSQFDIGTNIAYTSKLEEVGLTFDYSF